MKATLTNRPQKFTSSHRKERNGLYSEYAVLAVNPAGPSDDNGEYVRELVCLRIYWPGATNVYACLWVDHANFHSGSGVAGGGGYCKQSGAAAEAIRNAGIDLDQNIHGAGTRAIEDACMAIAKEILPEGWLPVLHVAHA